MYGIIGKKIGMTSIYNEEGKNLPCTIIEAGPCIVTQLKTEDNDGYVAVQLGFEEKKAKHTTKAMQGHFTKAKTTPKAKLVEFIGFDEDIKLGDALNVDLFKEGDFVDIAGTSKGKGFQGVVKRHGFRGVGDKTHGQHNRERAPGSIGASSYPSRVFKGMKMAGRMGGSQVTVLNLKVLKINSKDNTMIVQGAVPGANGSYLIIEK